METRPAAVTAGVPRTRLDFAYDAEGRRTQKSVLTNWNGSLYLATNVTRFLYDPGIQTGGGWNLLAEVKRDAMTHTLRTISTVNLAFAVLAATG